MSGCARILLSSSSTMMCDGCYELNEPHATRWGSP